MTNPKRTDYSIGPFSFVKTVRYQLVALIGERKTKKLSFPFEHIKKNFISLPHGQITELFLFYKSKVALITFDKLSRPFGNCEKVHMLAFPLVGYERDYSPVFV